MHLIITNTNINCEQAELNGDILPIAKRLLNDLWHRYQLVYAVIEFPLACPRRFITFDGNKRPNNNLYNRTITVIEKEDLDETLKKSQNTLSDGFPLKINLFHRFPTSFKQCHKIYNYMKFDINITNGFCGMDALIMHDFIKTFKFNVTYVDNNRTNKYGYVVSGHATGSLGAVIRREIDISFNSRFIAMYMNSGFDFLNYVSSDSLCALTMIPDIVPLWQYPINMYNYKQWMAGHINYMFTTLRRYDQFRTLQDICDSNIAVYTSPGILMLLNAETVDNSTNDVFTTILKRLKLFSANSSYTVEEKNMAMIRRRIDITLEILVNHTDKDGRPSLYVINDCFRNFYLSYIVRSGFLFTSQIQDFMMRMVEAGFPEKYYKWTSFTLRLGDILHNPTSEPRLFTKITLQEQRIPFVLLISGYIVSTIIFMVEKWWSSHKLNIMQNESSQF
ncbi:uncharacterized protein LOC113521839 [Galleria mellonella]|uniref:Uncharacterized protein LOC113521839 n=1 Tax=Galleria mellonella TaxID=7137 RepID=A0A6J1X2E5_GALME|nr:uncharacterized protein LOC113521839 [Galleria mellonella]